MLNILKVSILRKSGRRRRERCSNRNVQRLVLRLCVVRSSGTCCSCYRRQFKPVQRRIVHSLKELDDSRYNKVANIVGHTMQYHYTEMRVLVTLWCKLVETLIDAKETGEIY